jgi:hypothetical protein
MLQVKHVEQDLHCQIEIIDIRFCGYVMIKYGSFESLEVPCQIVAIPHYPGKAYLTKYI